MRQDTSSQYCNSIAKSHSAIWVTTQRVTGSKACNCTVQTQVLLQASVQSQVVLSPKKKKKKKKKIVHLAMLLFAMILLVTKEKKSLAKLRLD